MDIDAMTAFESDYDKTEMEILVLTNHALVGASRSQGEVLWTASKSFLAYVELDTGELKIGDGRIVWPLTEQEEKNDRMAWTRRFKQDCIYHIKVRRLVDDAVDERRTSSYNNRFLVVQVLEQDVENETLHAVLEDYKKPVTLTDEVLGEFHLDKDLELFEGEIDWLGKSVLVSMDVDRLDESTWQQALSVLRVLFDQQIEKDRAFKDFAADKLLTLAREWQQSEDEPGPEVSKKDFMDKMTLSTLAVTSEDNYVAFYDDGDLFWGHAITVYGNLHEGLQTATIEG